MGNGTFRQNLKSHHQIHQNFHHLDLFRHSHLRPLRFFQEVSAGTKFALSAYDRVPVMTCKFDRVVTPDGFVVLQ